jgi:VWFA-related protein
MDGRWVFCRAAFATAAVLMLIDPGARGQTADTSQAPVQAPIQLRVNSNLVVVRVVVRDGQGKPVLGLKKEDFRLSDRGKEQTITQFEEHVGPSAAAGTPGTAQSASTTALPENFLALYFDDLYISVADLNQARNAADRFLTTHLQPGDRVGIFTSSATLSDFTSDPKQIHEALQKLLASPRSLTRVQDCLQISDYQAKEIEGTLTYDPNDDAWKVAMDDAVRCNPHTPEKVLEGIIITQARQVIDQAHVLTRFNFDGLERAVQATAQMPGRRTVVLVSPGFLAESEQEPLNKVIDNALRAQVAISALDPKGVAVMMDEADASKHEIGGREGRALEKTREVSAVQVLADVADGTGGQYFHNDNDLNAGFEALAGSPSYYTLAFAPKDVKLDGQFHPLKVTLVEKQKGVSVQARRGYFAAPNQPESAPESAVTEAKSASPPASGVNPSASAASPSPIDPATHEQIREALFAKNDTSQLVVKLDTKIAVGEGETRELSLSTHVDGKDLPFRKDGVNSLNTVTFVFAVFDAKGNMLPPQQKHVDLVVPDAQMQSFFQAGVDEDATFQLKPGSYRLREVVIDAVEHHMTSFSRSLKVQ